MTHSVAHIDRHRPPVDPGILARWQTTGCLAAADVATILADRDPADAHPLASYVARLRAAMNAIERADAIIQNEVDKCCGCDVGGTAARRLAEAGLLRTIPFVTDEMRLLLDAEVDA